ncbi:hypothetical protein HMPREF9144_0070 [Prevotella pallens ATCC 700821]|uniref:Uncharacterized protein n=1 Tax=Prevotella pallens ATCC 700821 TaxID=997353 RepID=F9DEI0_9BACT|nr:hypothetical protein HMPREF9144_0070 [Prevotella pallens ATCC 700821]
MELSLYKGRICYICLLVKSVQNSLLLNRSRNRNIGVYVDKEENLYNNTSIYKL